MTLTDYFINNLHLQREWASDRNSISPDDLTPYTRAKVWWRCEKGHEWHAALDSRVSLGRSCPYCANQMVIPGENDIATMAPETAALWHPTKNGDLTPAAVMPGSRRRIWWRCKRNHEWEAPAYSMNAGFGCPYCSGRNAIPGETDLATTNPEILKMWHEKNTLKPETVTAGSEKRAWWRCERGHEWEAVISSVAARGCGCPYCTGKLAIPGETDLASQRPELMGEWDFGKNTVDPTRTTQASHDRVWWRCALGHSYAAMVFSRTREKGSGCPYCTGKRALAGFNDLATLKPKLADQWHPSLNGALSPRDVTLGSNKKVWWRCADGHVWQAYIYARTKPNGTGCPVCAGQVKRANIGRYLPPQTRVKI